MSIRADTLFAYNPRGRMLHNNEPDGDPAPDLFLGCTSGGSVIRFGEEAPESLVIPLTEIVERHPAANDLRIPRALQDSLTVELDRHAANIAAEDGGPAFRFPDSTIERSGVIKVTEDNVQFLRETFPWVHRGFATCQPCFVVVRDGEAVSVCFSSRVGADACEAGLETVSEFRGLGFAAAVTSAWGKSVRDSGRTPLYSTVWDNRASQAVARSLGLIMIGSDMSWSMEPDPVRR